jgi:hypothetical protein
VEAQGLNKPNKPSALPPYSRKERKPEGGGHTQIRGSQESKKTLPPKKRNKKKEQKKSPTNETRAAKSKAFLAHRSLALRPSSSSEGRAWLTKGKIKPAAGKIDQCGKTTSNGKAFPLLLPLALPSRPS